MSDSRVYIFQGNSLVVPQYVKDDEAPFGVDRDVADRAFGRLDYCGVLPIGLAGKSQMSEMSIDCFLLKDDVKLPVGWRCVLIRQLLSVVIGKLPEESANSTRDENEGEEGCIKRLLHCFHVLQWRNDSVYCGSCGEKNGDSPVELARLCPRCGRVEYPRISPAVIVLITDDDDRILLAHNKKFKDRVYSLIAGFVEAGESLEAAAYREIKEELTIGVKDIRYVQSQSWPFPNSLMVGFTARYAGGELKPDGVEILDARWLTREAVRQGEVDLPAPGSVSRYLINRWLG